MSGAGGAAGWGGWFASAASALQEKTRTAAERTNEAIAAARARSQALRDRASGQEALLEHYCATQDLLSLACDALTEESFLSFPHARMATSQAADAPDGREGAAGNDARDSATPWTMSVWQQCHAKLALERCPPIAALQRSLTSADGAGMSEARFWEIYFALVGPLLPPGWDTRPDAPPLPAASTGKLGAWAASLSQNVVANLTEALKDTGPGHQAFEVEGGEAMERGGGAADGGAAAPDAGGPVRDPDSSWKEYDDGPRQGTPPQAGDVMEGLTNWLAGAGQRVTEGAERAQRAARTIDYRGAGSKFVSLMSSGRERAGRLAAGMRRGDGAAPAAAAHVVDTRGAYDQALSPPKATAVPDSAEDAPEEQAGTAEGGERAAGAPEGAEAAREADGEDPEIEAFLREVEDEEEGGGWENLGDGEAREQEAEEKGEEDLEEFEAMFGDLDTKDD